MRIIKINNKKAFTLIEMLIVVIILVVLTAVALPIFTHQADNAKIATDDANLRAGKALASALFMLGEEDFSEKMYYDFENERYVSEEPEPYGKTSEHSGMTISAKINATGDGIVVQWE